MKKILLTLCCAAVAMTASADKVTFVPMFGGYQPTAEDGKVITIPMSWAGQTLYCDAFNMYIDGDSRVINNGAIYMRSSEDIQAYVTIRPCAGITIKQIEFRLFPNYDKIRTLFDNTTLDETGVIQRWSGELVGSDKLNNEAKFMLHKTGETPTSDEAVRLHAISVEYEGTVGRCLAPKADSDGIVTDKSVVLTCDEPGATIWYSTNASCKYYVYDQAPDSLFEKYDGTPINISQVTKINAFATVDGKKKSGLYYNWFVPGPEESHHAVFDYSRPYTLNPSFEWTPFTVKTVTVANIPYKNNGITLHHYSTASKATNSVRFMSTEAYGRMGEIRYAANNNKNNNKLDISTDNPENYICQITLVGSILSNKFGAAQKLVVYDDENKKYVVSDEPYVFPGNIDYENEEAPNYKDKMFVQTAEFPSASSKFVQTWRLSDDYEGGPSNHVVFDMVDAAATANINEIHVFYWGEAPEGGDTGIDGIVADGFDENAPVEYFNLQGVRVANPQGGIFIRRQGSKASKVYVK